MTNILQDAVTWIGGQLKDHCGLTVNYYRSSSSVEITATAVMHEYEIVDVDGTVTAMLVRDYIVHAADLVISEATITPRAGDRIIETINSVSCTFEVVPLGSQKEYEPLDPDSVLWKIHTKRIA